MASASSSFSPSFPALEEEGAKARGPPPQNGSSKEEEAGREDEGEEEEEGERMS